ncbi:MAG: hypothetical protein ACOYB3_11610 [Azonexus sp.]
MKTLMKIVAATLTGAFLTLSASAAFADGRGHDRDYDRRYYDDRGWEHRHHHYHRGPPVVYAPARYYAPAPVYYGAPAAVYQPNYYVPRPAPAVTIGISPIVIPLH